MPDLRRASAVAASLWKRPAVRVAGIAAAACLALALVLLFVLSVRLAALREFRATGPSWSFPSRIYSDRLELSTGRVLPVATLAAHLGIRGYTRAGVPLSRPGTWAPTPGGAEIFLRGVGDGHDPDHGAGRVQVVIDRGRIVSVMTIDHGARAAGDSAVPALEPLWLGATYDSMRVERVWIPLAPHSARGARRRDRLRGPSLSQPLRHRPALERARVRAQRAGRRRAAGREHHHAAARARAVPGRERTLGRKLARRCWPSGSRCCSPRTRSWRCT
jgi:hypothetical protein